jgi:lipoprotein-anchoring transpeptidase ErfK/SrfK
MKHLFLFVFLLTFLIPCETFAKITSVSLLISDTQGQLLSTLSYEMKNWAGGVSLAVADLGWDNIPELILGNGVGNEPRVSILRQDGSVVGSFLAYAPDMGSGIFVASCDLTGDGTSEIITSAQYGGGPHVRLFTNYGHAMGPGFFAYDEKFRGGVTITCGDMDEDGITELVTGAGPTGGPHVKIWSWQDGRIVLERQFFAFDANDTRGVAVSVEKGELVTTPYTQTADVQAVAVADHPLWSIPLQTVYADLHQDGAQEQITAPSRPLGYAGESQHVIVDLSTQQLYAFENGVAANTFPISAAKWPWTTPVGSHEVLAKLPWVDYTWNYGAENPNNYSLGLVPWNLRIYPHIYIHYAYWHHNFGEPMSHGCINASLVDMMWIYDWAQVGTPVDVQ